MNIPSIIIHSERPRLSGWRYLWAKRVTGFTSARHCAGCLRGDYIEAFGLGTQPNRTVALETLGAGDIVYFCGVASPYRWSNNMHLAVRITGKEEDVASVSMFNGDELTVASAIRLPFGDEVAERDFAGKSASYRTCRNFQFGAQMVAEGVL